MSLLDYCSTSFALDILSCDSVCFFGLTLTLTVLRPPLFRNRDYKSSPVALKADTQAIHINDPLHLFSHFLCVYFSLVEILVCSDEHMADRYTVFPLGHSSVERFGYASAVSRCLQFAWYGSLLLWVPYLSEYYKLLFLVPFALRFGEYIGQAHCNGLDSCACPPAVQGALTDWSWNALFTRVSSAKFLRPLYSTSENELHGKRRECDETLRDLGLSYAWFHYHLSVVFTVRIYVHTANLLPVHWEIQIRSSVRSQGNYLAANQFGSMMEWFTYWMELNPIFVHFQTKFLFHVNFKPATSRLHECSRAQQLTHREFIFSAVLNWCK